MNKWEWATPIYEKEKFTLYKARATNSAKKSGKSYGFRVHFAFNKGTGNIIFFGLLAKTEKAIFSDQEYMELVETMVHEIEANELIPLDLRKGEIEW